MFLTDPWPPGSGPCRRAGFDVYLLVLRSGWALPVLERLRAAGLSCGDLVSDCSSETPEMRFESPLATYFDAVSFSCITRHRKPAPEAHLAAVRALEVPPEECLHVGDGGSDELSGASALGMRTVRYAPSDAECGGSIDEELDWTGVVVTDLSDLLPDRDLKRPPHGGLDGLRMERIRVTALMPQPGQSRASSSSSSGKRLPSRSGRAV